MEISGGGCLEEHKEFVSQSKCVMSIRGKSIGKSMDKSMGKTIGKSTSKSMGLAKAWARA